MNTNRHESWMICKNFNDHAEGESTVIREGLVISMMFANHPISRYGNYPMGWWASMTSSVDPPVRHVMKVCE